MRNKNLIKLVAFTLILFILTPMTTVFAKQFPDVKTDHWAYTYIDKLSDNNIITGYDDGQYRPDASVKFLEVLKLLQGIMAPSATELKEARDKYEATAKSNGVADWAIDAVSIAIARGVITTENLAKANSQGLIKQDTTLYPDRSSIAVYYARALKMSPSSDTSVLKYDDLNSIDKTVQEHLVPLVKAGIFAATGSEGKFAGSRPIKRSEMAKITYLSYEETKKQPIETTKEVKGTVTYKTDVNNLKAIIVNIGNNQNIAYNVDEYTAYTLNGRIATFNDVAERQEVKITYVNTDKYDSKNLAKKVELTATSSTGVGYVVSKTNDSLRIKYVENTTNIDTNKSLQFNTDKTGDFKVDSNSAMTIYDKKVNLNEINFDDMIEFKVEGGNIKEAKIFPRTYNVTGTVTDYNLTGFDRKGTITLRLSDNKDYIFHIEDTSRLSNLNSLIRNQRLTLRLLYKTVTQIDTSYSNEAFIGQVIGISTSSNNYGSGYVQTIKVRNTNNVERDFIVDSQTEIRDENGATYPYNNLNSLYGKNVRVESISNLAKKISVLSNTSSLKFTGRVFDVKRTGFYGNETFTVIIDIDTSNDTNEFKPGDRKEFSMRNNPLLNYGDRVEGTGYSYGNNEYEITLRKISY